MLLSSLSKARGAASRLSGLSTQYRHFKLKPGQIGVERHTAEPVPPGGIAEPGAIKPPLDHHKAKQVVKNLEAVMNAEDPSTIAKFYAPDAEVRVGMAHFKGRDELVRLLRAQWERELHWHRKAHLWVHDGSRVGIRFEAEWSTAEGVWYRTMGNELLELDDSGLIVAQDTAAYSVPIKASERTMQELSKIRAPGGRV